MAEQRDRKDHGSASTTQLHEQQKASPTTKGKKRPQLVKFYSVDSKRGRQLEYDKMPIEEKRKHYSCGSQYLTPADLPAWSQFHKRVPFPGSLKQRKYRVDSALNNTVSLWQGDITRLEVDAIVNAANSSLLGGGGVDGAIHRAASSALLAECRQLAGCPTGQAKITKGYRLPAKYVLHTVGPMSCHEEKLKSCYDCCYQLILKHGIRSVAFPCIATGIYGYPHEDAAHVALSITRQWLELHREKVDRIIFCVFQKIDYTIYGKLLHHYFPVENPVQRQALDDSEERLPPSQRPILQTSISAYGPETLATETGPVDRDVQTLLSTEEELSPSEISQQPVKDVPLTDNAAEAGDTSMSPSTPAVAPGPVAGSGGSVAGSGGPVAGGGGPETSVEDVANCKKSQGSHAMNTEHNFMDTSSPDSKEPPDSSTV